MYGRVWITGWDDVKSVKINVDLMFQDLNSVETPPPMDW